MTSDLGAIVSIVHGSIGYESEWLITDADGAQAHLILQPGAFLLADLGLPGMMATRSPE